MHSPPPRRAPIREFSGTYESLPARSVQVRLHKVLFVTTHSLDHNKSNSVGHIKELYHHISTTYNLQLVINYREVSPKSGAVLYLAVCAAALYLLAFTVEEEEAFPEISSILSRIIFPYLN